MAVKASWLNPRRAVEALDDLHELRRRIVFTILVSNSHDHLTNHGFIYAGGNRWRLSPAFGISLLPSRRKVQEIDIIQGRSFDASLNIALKACNFFDLELEDENNPASQTGNIIQRAGSRL